MRGTFGSHFAWGARHLMNLDHILKGSKKSSFVKLSACGFGNHDDSVRKAQHFGCLGFIFVACTILCRPQQENCHSRGARNVLGKSNLCVCVCLRNLQVALNILRGASFEAVCANVLALRACRIAFPMAPCLVSLFL